jgi:large subunit ribosomal protein L1
VVQDIAKAVKEYAAGKVEFRNDDGGNLHIPVGKASFDSQALVDNIEMFLAYIRKQRPTTVKGAFIKKVCIAASMSPSVQIESSNS